MKEGCTYQLFYFHHHRHLCWWSKSVLLYGWNLPGLRPALQGPPRSLHLYIFGRTVLEWDNLPTWESKYAPGACQLRGGQAHSRHVNEPDLVSRQGGASAGRAGVTVPQSDHSRTGTRMKCELIIPLAMTALLSNASHSVLPVPTRTAVCWYSIITSSSFPFFFNWHSDDCKSLERVSGLCTMLIAMSSW